MSIPLLTVTPSSAASAYQRAASSVSGSAPDTGFGATLDRAMRDAVTLGEDADRKSQNAVINGGDITPVVTAVSKAQLALQEIVSVRDKVVQAYQEVMRMSI